MICNVIELKFPAVHVIDADIKRKNCATKNVGVERNSECT